MDFPPRRKSCIGKSVTTLQAALVALLFIFLLLHPGCVANHGVAQAKKPDPYSPLLNLAQQAKDDFRARMYPWHLIAQEVVAREPTQAVRAYVLRSFESAIDALLAEAYRSPETARAVEVALRRLLEARGQTSVTGDIFSQIIDRETAGDQVGARPAAAIRNSVAVTDLPAALAPLMPGELLPEGLLGNKALPAYRRATELHPEEPWTWIAIAWMGEAGRTPLSEAESKLRTRLGTPTVIFWMGEIDRPEIAEVESAIDKAEAAASAGRDDDAAIAALHVRARLRLAQGRVNEAERALLAAVELAEQRARIEPSLQANLALCLNLLGEFYVRQGDHGRAASAYRSAFEIRERLAAAAPNDEARQLDLAASHFRLAVLADETRAGTEATEQRKEAYRINRAVLLRHPFTPIFNVLSSSLLSMALQNVFLLAGILTLVGGFVLLAQYRRTVDRWMKVAASASRQLAASPAETPPAADAGGGELAIRSLAPTAGEGSFAPRSAPIAAAGRALRSAAFVYVLAGCAFAAVAPVLADWLSFFWMWAGPVVWVLGLLWVVLTLVGGFILARYRRTVDRWMKAAASASRQLAASPAETPPAADAGGGELAIRSLAPTAGEGSFAPRSAPIAAAGRALRSAAFVYVLAGCAFAAVATVFFSLSLDLDYLPGRTALAFWSWGWPVVLVLGLLWGRDRMRIVLTLGIYFGGLLFLCAVSAANGTALDLFGVSVPAFFLPLSFWAVLMKHTPFLLFFLDRRVRSVGPVLLVFTLIISIGWLLGQVVKSMPVIIMSPLPQYLSGFLGMAVFALPAWQAIDRIRRVYQAKWLNDQMLVFDAIWLLQALILCLHLSAEGLSGWGGLAAFIAYKLVSTIGLWPLAAAASRRPAAKLLLLRVFGFRGRTERLFDVLEARWRYAGPIQMIAAPDLAARTIDPGEFMDFLSGRLRHRFIIEPGDLERRLAEIDLRPDADGRFRVNDIFCGNETWQAAVERLMAQTDLVVMDLRGFSPQNKGCAFELQALLDTVPIGRFVLLVDSSDQPFLRRTLAECARRIPATSPNKEIRDPITMLEVGKSDLAAVNALLAIADSVFAQTATPLVPAAAVREPPTQRIRRAARRLYQQFLISPEGRRLSLKVGIRKQLNLFTGLLLPLLTKRLLRSENRSVAANYQFSHDALIEPVLATRRWKALLLGWLGLGISYICFAILGILAVLVANQILTAQLPILAKLLIAFGIASPGIALLPMLRKSIYTLRRYRPRTHEELADAVVVHQSKIRTFYASIGILAGGCLFFVAIFFEAFLVVNIIQAYNGNLNDPDLGHLRQSISEMGVGLDTIAIVITILIVLVFGARVLRWGIQKLLQTPHMMPPQPMEVTPRAPAFSGLGVVAGAIGLLAAVILACTALMEMSCAHYLQGQLPQWVPSNWFNTLAHDCIKSYNTGYGANNILDWLVLIVALAEASLILRRSSVKMRVFYHAHSKRATRLAEPDQALRNARF